MSPSQEGLNTSIDDGSATTRPNFGKATPNSAT